MAAFSKNGGWFCYYDAILIAYILGGKEEKLFCKLIIKINRIWLFN